MTTAKRRRSSFLAPPDGGKNGNDTKDAADAAVGSPSDLFRRKKRRRGAASDSVLASGNASSLATAAIVEKDAGSASVRVSPTPASSRDLQGAKTFADLAADGVVSAWSLHFVSSVLKFQRTSPVQCVVLPLVVKEHRDVAVEACTGSGKTLAYLIPCVEILVKASSQAALSLPSSKKKGAEGLQQAANRCCRVGGLIIAPTRELVSQIHSVLSQYLESASSWVAQNGAEATGKGAIVVPNALSLTGGGNVSRDVEWIRRKAGSEDGSQPLTLLTATPGRLGHLLEVLVLNQDWSFRDFEVLIFDEADRLLENSSFQRQLSDILSCLPKQRRTGLFSATLPAGMAEMIKAGMRNPVYVRVNVVASKQVGTQATDGSRRNERDATIAEEDEADFNMGSQAVSASAPDSGAIKHTTPLGLTNFYVQLERSHKLPFLLKFLKLFIVPRARGNNGAKCIVFFVTGCCVTYYHQILSDLKKTSQKLLPNDFLIERLHGKMNQSSRTNACKRFLDAKATTGAILLCTDVAARGIDFPDVDWIVQYDAPLDPAMFVHRIGRTARAGKSGRSLLMVSKGEDTCVNFFDNRNVQLADWSDPDENPLLEEFQEKSAEDTLAKQIKLPGIPTKVDEARLKGEPTPVYIKEEDYETGDEAMDDKAESKSAFPLPVGQALVERLRDFQRRCILKDRACLMKASAAFVSFLRAYKEHQLKFIFPFKALDIGDFATSLSLLRLPRVKEILGHSIANFKQSAIDPALIPFSNTHREAQRQNAMHQKWEERDLEAKKSNKSPPNEQKSQDIKIPLSKLPVTPEPVKHRSRTEKRQAKRRQKIDEWEELQLEERLNKKLRLHKITQAQFDKQMKGLRASDGLLDSGESDASDDEAERTSG